MAGRTPQSSGATAVTGYAKRVRGALTWAANSRQRCCIVKAFLGSNRQRGGYIMFIIEKRF
ncbi:hypothetical protein HORIV_46270 [Vreelandella olivaria]|uniref:Uncharacterized protein n=1 Tax=Vreelandella olivaria TaxID=390919 RepID=A0ABM7GNG8_9GAMM|nr:hypothetical protein HORIV_46270 [Halomonas olivaria]